MNPQDSAFIDFVKEEYIDCGIPIPQEDLEKLIEIVAKLQTTVDSLQRELKERMKQNWRRS